jgi:hypothetical protein
MAMMKQASPDRRQWTDWLPHLISACALLTLLTAVMAGILGQRLDTLAQNQQNAVQLAKTQNAKDLSAVLGKARSQWEQQKTRLEKELLSLKLKVKAEQKTNASVRKRLTMMQKELMALKTGVAPKAKVVQATAPASTVSAPAAPALVEQNPAAPQTAPSQAAVVPVERAAAPVAKTQPAGAVQPAGAGETTSVGAVKAPPAPQVSDAAKTPEAAAASMDGVKSAVLAVPEAGDGTSEQ